jgi:hypothetical protein
MNTGILLFALTAAKFPFLLISDLNLNNTKA